MNRDPRHENWEPLPPDVAEWMGAVETGAGLGLVASGSSPSWWLRWRAPRREPRPATRAEG